MVCGLCWGSVVVLGLLVVVWNYFLSCVENLLCTSMSFRLLCLEYERNGWRGKSCERVVSFFMIYQCSRRMRESEGRSVL